MGGTVLRQSSFKLNTESENLTLEENRQIRTKTHQYNSPLLSNWKWAMNEKRQFLPRVEFCGKLVEVLFPIYAKAKFNSIRQSRANTDSRLGLRKSRTNLKHRHIPCLPFSIASSFSILTCTLRGRFSSSISSLNLEWFLVMLEKCKLKKYG